MNIDENYFLKNFNDFKKDIKNLKFSSKFLAIYKKKYFEKTKEKIIFLINNNVKEYLNILGELRYLFTIEIERSMENILDKKEKLIIYNFGDKEFHSQLLTHRITKKLPTFCFNSTDAPNIILNILKNNFYDKNIGLNFNKITNICAFSKDYNFKERFLKKYNLQEEFNLEKPLIYFGVKFNSDFQKIKMCKNIVFLIWNGFDCDIKNRNYKNFMLILKKNKNIIHIAISDNISENLTQSNIQHIRLNLNLCNTDIFKPPIKKGKNIFVWNNDNINLKIINELKKYYRNINFIYSNNLDLPYDKLPNIYKNCFIGLRLTSSDGNLDMVNEFNSMKIPIVHNFSQNGLKWNNINDIKKHIDNHKEFEFVEQVEVNINNINNNYLKLIYSNIDEFTTFLKKYSRILLISNENIELGSLINFKELFNFLLKKKYIIQLLITNNKKKLITSIKKFNPDAIIALNYEIILKKLTNCIIINLITNIYNNKLNKYYYEKGSEIFINSKIIQNINNSDYTFVNSPELKKILLKYDTDIKLLYSTFIPYYGKFINRKKKNLEYDIGVIYSDFKNKKNNLNFLKKLENKNVILIGKNSENYGFKSVGWVDSNKLQKYYEKINYLIVDTYLPGFNNAITQAIINNCLLNYRNIVDINSNYINIIKDEEYIICNTNVKIWNYNLKEGIYMIDGVRDKEIAVFLVGKKNERVSLRDILSNLNIYYKIIGYNNEILKPLEIQNLYYNMGLINFDMKKIGLGEIFDYYDKSSMFNVEILEKKFYYNLGKNRKDLNNKEFTEFILNNTDKIIDKKVLLLSKKISSYGGNQKTALQLIKLLEKYYIVELISININDKEYDFEIDKLVDNIPNSYIIREKNKNNIIEKINNTNYELIINNKFDNIFEFIDKINKKMIVITHNSMDPFNKLIIDNKDKISKVCTINNFHREVLYKNGINNTAKIYNWIEKVGYNNKIKFTQKIAFVGRFSKEKNLHLLVKAFRNIYNLKLILIGDGNMEIDNTRNIEKMGYMDNDNILKTLKDCDYLILPSYTEGLPFVILEAMSIGIPCIYSKIAGSDEIIQDRGFTFELKGYEKCKYNMNWDVFEEVDKYKNENINNIVEVIKKAYRIPFNEYKIMSNKCIKFIRENYLKDIAEKRNKELLGIK